MDDPVVRLRGIALALPEASERVSHGEACFFAGSRASSRQFVSLDDHHHGVDHLSFWCPAAPGVQEELIAADPEHYFRPPYVGHRGWLGVTLDNDPDWDEIAGIVRDAFCQVATRKLIAQLPGGA